MKSAFRLLSIAWVLLSFATASGQWTQVDTLTRNSVPDEHSLQSLAVDAGDTLHAAWARDEGGGWKVHYSQRPPTGEWRSAVSLTDSVPTSFQPALAVNPATGQAHVAYTTSYGLSDEIGLSWDSAGIWRWARITNNGEQDLAPTIAIDGQGYVHLAWIGQDTSAQWKIFYGTNRSGTWTHQLLSGSELGPFGSGAVPFIAVTLSGVAHIFYRGGDFGTYQIHHARNSIPGGVSWSYDFLVTPNGNDFSASAVITPDESIHLIASGNDGFGFPPHAYYLRKPPGGNWSTPELANTTGNGWGGSIFIDRFGRAHITWNETSGNIYTGNLFYASNSSGAWVSAPISSDAKTYSGVLVLVQAGIGHALAYNGETFASEEILVFRSPGPLTSISDRDETPVNVSLEQNYPNPFNPATHVRFRISNFGIVSLTVYDLLGQTVAVLVNEAKAPGSYAVEWDARGITSGVYYYTLESEGQRLTRRMLLVK